MKNLTLSCLVLVAACGGRPTSPARLPASACGVAQRAISVAADARARPYGLREHLARNFGDGRVSWLMRDADYQKYVVATSATRWGRCNSAGCFAFAAPAALIHAAVARASHDGAHAAGELGAALGLPARNFEGPLVMMTLDLDEAAVCARLPVDGDPGVWPCKTADDRDCFKFGGYTSGGVPELMLVDAPVARTAITPVP